jgi:DnaJ-class molecular chaperone
MASICTSDVRTYYEILGVDQHISDHELKKAFRQLIITQHPDKHPNDEKIYREFLLITEAYEVLSDPQKRMDYDERMESRSHEYIPRKSDSNYTPTFFSNVKFYTRGVDVEFAWSETNQNIPITDLDDGEDIFLRRKAEFAEFSNQTTL